MTNPGWRRLWQLVDHWLYWPAWVALVLASAGLILAPGSQFLLILVIELLVGVGVLWGALALLALHHRRRLGSWAGVFVLAAGLAAGLAVPGQVEGLLGGLRVVAILTTLPLLWFGLSYRMVRHDAGLALIVVILIALIWSMALANLAAGGPDHLLLQLATDADSGRQWWLNTLLLSLYCVCPTAPLTFLGWLGVRLWQEFSAQSPI